MKRSPLRKGRPYAILAALAATIAVTLPFVLTAPGCGLQGEGQRCDRNTSATPSDPDTGNDDCDTAAGLYCISKDVLGTSTDVCCPRGPSENPNCQVGNGEGGGTAGSTTAAVTSAAATTSSATSTSTATSTATATSTSAGTSTSTGTGAGGAGGGP